MNMLQSYSENNLKPSKLKGLINRYLSELDVTKDSKNTYLGNINQFIAYLDNASIDELTRSTILNYKKYLIDLGLSSYTINSRLVAVRSLFSFLDINNQFADITRGIKTLKSPKNFSKDALTVEQVSEILQKIDRSTLTGKRNYALILLLVSTALRIGEVRTADIEDIRNMNDQTVLFIKGKGRDSKDDYVILDNEVTKAIYDYLSMRKAKSGAIFVGESNRSEDRLHRNSLSRIVKECFRNAGIDSNRLTAHSTRHFSVTASLIAGATIQEAQALARHQNINTTMIYAHNLDRLESNAESKISKLLREKGAI